MFGKRRRLKRIQPQRVKPPAYGVRPSARPIRQKRLKILLGLAAVLGMTYVIHSHHLVILYAEKRWTEPASTLVLLLMISWGFWVYMARFQREVLASVKRFLLVASLIVGTVTIARVLTLVKPGDVPVNLAYLVPISFTTLTLTIVFNPRFGLFATAYTALAVGLVLTFPGSQAPPLDPSVSPAEAARFLVRPGPGVLPVLLVLVSGAVFAGFSVGRIRDRSRLIKVGAGVGALTAVLIILAEMSGGRGFDSIDSLRFLMRDPMWGLIYGLMLGFLVSGALPFIEHFFEVTTDISLIELSDHNHPLLRRLLLTAPGTYHHSFITGTLAEAAAEAIGANSLLARVGGYFHDIGKMTKPEYFTENESLKGSHHARLSPAMSTLIIVSHTKDGVELAKDYNLPPAITDFIPQHHGTSVIEYFYREALERSAGKQEVNRDTFRHTGPKPQTRETAIVAIADSVEAASRSLSDPTPARLSNLVHKIVTQKLMDEQLDESTLTFQELKVVEDTFVRVLSGIFHGRIAYPEVATRKAL